MPSWPPVVWPRIKPTEPAPEPQAEHSPEVPFFRQAVLPAREVRKRPAEVRYVVPSALESPLPPPPASRRAWGWLCLPVGLLLLAAGLMGGQVWRAQQRELAASQLQLAETQQAYFALQIKPPVDPHTAEQLRVQTQQCASLTAQLKAAEAKITTTTGKLKTAVEHASAREQELQKLVAFLKEELKASEARVAELQGLLQPSIEVKKAR